MGKNQQQKPSHKRVAPFHKGTVDYRKSSTTRTFPKDTRTDAEIWSDFYKNGFM
jgi:hypothetical protein